MNTPEKLSPREAEVLSLMAQGNDEGKIAEMLFLSKRTVQFHTNSIRQKAGVSYTWQALLLYLKTATGKSV